MMIKSPAASQVADFIWVFPLVFASSIFVPLDSMPGWLQVFAADQPIAVVTDAVRALFAGDTVSIMPALVWIGAIVVIFVPLVVTSMLGD